MDDREMREAAETDRVRQRNTDAYKKRIAELEADNARLRIVARFVMERVADTGSDRNFPVSYQCAVRELAALGVEL